jgi:hypothetical protein
VNHIFKGTVKKGIEKAELPFIVRRLSKADLEEILFVQEQVLNKLENKNVLQPLTIEEYQYILGSNGLMIGAFAEGDLIAFRALVVPPVDEEHLGIDIGLSKDELGKVIYQEISNVIFDYRGNGLQKLLANLIMNELDREEHDFRYICCTVAPFNFPSLKDKFAQGMMIAALKEKYGGLLRYIFVKDLAETELAEWQDIKIIKMADIAVQKEILKAGWRGYKMEEKQNEMWVYFGRLIPIYS